MKRDAAVLVWTMVSWPSDTEPMLSVEISGSSRTLGEPPGEKVDTSRWPVTWATNAESPPKLLTPLYKLLQPIQLLQKLSWLCLLMSISI